jgi:hypothetical protein
VAYITVTNVAQHEVMRSTRLCLFLSNDNLPDIAARAITLISSMDSPFTALKVRMLQP